MSEHKDDEKKQSYSVDDILAEYGSGKYGKSKILEFPEQPRRPEPEPPKEDGPPGGGRGAGRVSTAGARRRSKTGGAEKAPARQGGQAVQTAEAGRAGG